MKTTKEKTTEQFTEEELTTFLTVLESIKLNLKEEVVFKKAFGEENAYDYLWDFNHHLNDDYLKFLRLYPREKTMKVLKILATI